MAANSTSCSADDIGLQLGQHGGDAADITPRSVPMRDGCCRSRRASGLRPGPSAHSRPGAGRSAAAAAAIHPADVTRSQGSGRRSHWPSRSPNSEVISATPGNRPMALPTRKSRRLISETPDTRLTTENGAIGTSRISAMATMPRCPRRLPRRRGACRPATHALAGRRTRPMQKVTAPAEQEPSHRIGEAEPRAHGGGGEGDHQGDRYQQLAADHEGRQHGQPPQRAGSVAVSWATPKPRRPSSRPTTSRYPGTMAVAMMSASTTTPKRVKQVAQPPPARRRGQVQGDPLGGERLVEIGEARRCRELPDQRREPQPQVAHATRPKGL